jgi:hypothetical protein
MRLRRGLAVLFVIWSLVLPGLVPTAGAVPEMSQQTDVNALLPSESRVNATAVFGNNAIGTSTDSGQSGWMNGSRFTASATGGAVTSMSVYVDMVAAAPNNQYQVAVYTDSNGSPGALVAKSGTGTLTANAWNTIPIAATLNANASYWLMYNTNGDNNMAFDNGATNQGGYSAASVAFETWPQSFGTAVRWTAKFSIYASR